MTCNNLNAPLGMGLWEGVPLRDVVWMTRPVSDIRRVYYYGHHNEDPKQMFRSSLSLSRVLEDPPGEYPVLLAYKLNRRVPLRQTGRTRADDRAGSLRFQVRQVAAARGTDDLPAANDTYADENNDIDSWMKTFARFPDLSDRGALRRSLFRCRHRAGRDSGLSKVQVWLPSSGDALPTGDPYFTTALWQDAQMLAPPLHGEAECPRTL